MPSNDFRRGIVAVYPRAYRFYKLDWLDSPPLRANGRPVPCGPEGPIVEAALRPPRGAWPWKRLRTSPFAENADGYVVTTSGMRYTRRSGSLRASTA